MTSLYQLAERTEVGDRIRWVGAEADVDKPEPRTARRVLQTEKAVVVFAEGPRGGRAGFCVDETNAGQAWYGPEERDMGEVVRAELVDEGLRTAPWPDDRTP